MLTKVAVTNFKAIKKVEIELGKLTVLVGENGTGKSTLLQALEILKQSAINNRIVTDLPSLNIGPISGLIPPAQTCSLGFEGKSPVDFSKPLIIKELTYECKVDFDAQGIASYRSRISFPGLGITNEWARWGVQKIEPARIGPLGKVSFNIFPTNQIGLAFGLGGYQIDQPATPDDQRLAQDFYNQLSRISSFMLSVLQRFYFIAPLRGITDPSYQLLPQATGEYVARAGTQNLGSNLAANLVYNKGGTDTISKWEKEIVDVALSTEMAPGAQVHIRNPEKGTDYVNEGFGSNQLLFVLERIANSPYDSTIAVEEPEIHLHPKAQFRLGKKLATVVTSEGKQVIITTHSPDLIAGILAAVRHRSVSPDDVAIWFLERMENDITATRSEIDKEGKVATTALKSFVESSVIELAQYFE